MCYSAKKAVEIKMSCCILMSRTCTKDTILLKSLSSFFLFSKRAQNTCYPANGSKLKDRKENELIFLVS